MSFYSSFRQPPAERKGYTDCTEPCEKVTSVITNPDFLEDGVIGEASDFVLFTVEIPTEKQPNSSSANVSLF